MLKVYRVSCAAVAIFCAMLMAEAVAAEVVVADGEVTITRDEFEAALASAPSKIQALGATDVGDRLEFISGLVEVRKLAAVADTLTSESPGYWDLFFELLAVKRQFAYDQEVRKIDFPNPENLAREYYKTQKDKYATKPELRGSSHILLASPPGLPREEVRARAQELLDQLRAGADFTDYVDQYSDDKGTKARDGALAKQIRFGDPSITPPYSEALFSIEAIGEYAEITDSQFGIHIIRLDSIEEGGYYEYDEVRSAIYSDISAEFRSLASRTISRKYGISDDAFIDGPAMEELFEPYKQSEP